MNRRLDALAVERKLEELARDTSGVLDCHSVEAHQVGSNLVVRIHCTLKPELPIAKVHDITEMLEFKFRQAFPKSPRSPFTPTPWARPDRHAAFLTAVSNGRGFSAVFSPRTVTLVELGKGGPHPALPKS